MTSRQQPQMHSVIGFTNSTNNNSNNNNHKTSLSNSPPTMRRNKSFGSYLPAFTWRLHKLRQMDFELAIWQMMWLVVSPRRVYKSIYYHKQTKNQWARDDPAFVVLLCAGLSLMSVCYSVYFKLSIGGFLRTLLFMLFVDYVLVGCVVATGSWFLRAQHMAQTADQHVEWAYAFDVHTNSFLPVFLLTYVLQFVFIGILMQPESIVALVLGNSIYMAAVIYYCYITFLGYNALPFLQNGILFLYPVPIFFVFYCMAFFGLNFSQMIMHSYFGSQQQ